MVYINACVMHVYIRIVIYYHTTNFLFQKCQCFRQYKRVVLPFSSCQNYAHSRLSSLYYRKFGEDNVAAGKPIKSIIRNLFY